MAHTPAKHRTAIEAAKSFTLAAAAALVAVYGVIGFMLATDAPINSGSVTVHLAGLAGIYAVAHQLIAAAMVSHDKNES